MRPQSALVSRRRNPSANRPISAQPHRTIASPPFADASPQGNTSAPSIGSRTRVRPHSAVLHSRQQEEAAAAAASASHGEVGGGGPTRRPMSALKRGPSAVGSGRPLSATVSMPMCVSAATAARRAASAERQRKLARARHRIAESDAHQLLAEIFDICEALQVGNRFIMDLQKLLATSTTTRRVQLDQYGYPQPTGATDEDLAQLQQIRQDLADHRQVTMHVLGRIEARERVIGAFNWFVKQYTVGEGARKALGERDEIAAFKRQPLSAVAEVEAESIIASIGICSAQVLGAIDEWRSSADLLDVLVSGSTAYGAGAAPTAAAALRAPRSNMGSTASLVTASNNEHPSMAMVGGGGLVQRTLSSLSSARSEGVTSAGGGVGLPPPVERRFLFKGFDYAKRIAHEQDRIRRLREVWSRMSPYHVGRRADAEASNGEDEEGGGKPDSLASSMSSISRLELIRQQMEHDACTAIQRVFRGHRRRLAHSYHKIRTEAAVALQRWYRRFLRERQQMIDGGRHLAAVRLQAAWRGVFTRDRYRVLRRRARAACVIQRRWRAYSAHMYWHRALAEKRRCLAAVQCIARWMWSLKFKFNLEVHREAKRAALTVQRWFRSLRATHAWEAADHKSTVHGHYSIIQPKDVPLEQPPHALPMVDPIAASLAVGTDDAIEKSVCHDAANNNVTVAAATAADYSALEQSDGGFALDHSPIHPARCGGTSCHDDRDANDDALPSTPTNAADGSSGAADAANETVITHLRRDERSMAADEEAEPVKGKGGAFPPPREASAINDARGVGYEAPPSTREDVREEGATITMEDAVPSGHIAASVPFPSHCRRIVTRPLSAHQPTRGAIFYDTLEGGPRPPIADCNFWSGDSEAAAMIQQVGRGMLSRRSCSIQRGARLEAIAAAMEAARRGSAAVIVQVCARAHLSARRAAHTWSRDRIAAVVIQRWWLRWRRRTETVANRRHREYLLERTGGGAEGEEDPLDAMFGGPHVEHLRFRKQQAERISAWAKRQYDRRRRNAEAQRTIARAWYHYKCQREYFLRRHQHKLALLRAQEEARLAAIEQDRIRKHNAALVILYYYLKYRVRYLLSRIDAICEEIRSRPDREENAWVLQRFWKTTVARIQALKVARLRAKIQERSLQEERLLMAAVKAQSLYRLILAKRQVAERKRRIAADRNYAAALIQRNVRMFIAKVRADGMRLGHLSMYKEYRLLMLKSENMGWGTKK